MTNKRGLKLLLPLFVLLIFSPLAVAKEVHYGVYYGLFPAGEIKIDFAPQRVVVKGKSGGLLGLFYKYRLYLVYDVVNPASSFMVEEENKKTAPPKVEKKKPKGSLLEELMPVVKREYETTFKKIVSKAKASLSTEKGKVKLNIDRKVVYVPKIEPIRVEYPPAPVEVKVTVLPDGRVINAVLLKRSGNPKVDRAVLKFVKNLRFAPIGEPIIQEIYITFRFEV